MGSPLKDLQSSTCSVTTQIQRLTTYAAAGAEARAGGLRRLEAGAGAAGRAEGGGIDGDCWGGRR